MVEEGKPAPDFTLISDGGVDHAVSSSGEARRPLLLSQGRHARLHGEACGFRDAYSEFEQRGAVVLGVSPDDEASHVKFKDKFSLPFTLLADPEHEVAEKYGVWGEKKFAGKEYMGVKRSTFLIDAEGNVAKVMHNVKPDGHPEQVLAALP